MTLHVEYSNMVYNDVFLTWYAQRELAVGLAYFIV